jgi:hypothetical protein
MARLTAAERQRDYYQMRIENGRCPRCPNPPAPGRVLCAFHRQQQRERDAARYQRRKQELAS